MARKFPTLKRYCGAGAESSVAFVEELFSLSSCGNNGYNILYAILNIGTIILYQYSSNCLLLNAVLVSENCRAMMIFCGYFRI